MTGGVEQVGAAGLGPPRTLAWMRMLIGTVVDPLRTDAVARLALVTWTAGGLVVALRVSAPALFASNAPEFALAGAAVSLSFLAALSLADPLTRRIGPTAMAGRLRFAFEQGESSMRLALSLTLAQATFALVVSAPLGVAAAAIGLSPFTPTLIALVSVFASIIGSAVSVTERVTTNGEAISSIGAGVIAVVLAAAVVATTLLAPDPFSWQALVAGVVIYGGGALVCSSRRIRQHPLSVGNW